MDEEEARQYGFNLSKNVSLLDLLDEMKDKNKEYSIDSKQTKADKKRLDEWVKEPLPERQTKITTNVVPTSPRRSCKEVDDNSSSGTISIPAEIKTVNMTGASLNAKTALFAVSFLKKREEKLKRRHSEASEHYKKNNILPEDIPADVYLESLRVLKSHKEDREVNLFKEYREKKATNRLRQSLKKCASRQKEGNETRTLSSSEKKKKKITRHKSLKSFNSAALFEKDCMANPRDDEKLTRIASKERLAPMVVKPFGTPVKIRPSTTEAGFIDNDDGNDNEYMKNMETALDEMITEHDKQTTMKSFPVSPNPFGSPLRSRPLCRIFSSN